MDHEVYTLDDLLKGHLYDEIPEKRKIVMAKCKFVIDRNGRWVEGTVYKNTRGKFWTEENVLHVIMMLDIGLYEFVKTRSYTLKIFNVLLYINTN